MLIPDEFHLSSEVTITLLFDFYAAGDHARQTIHEITLTITKYIRVASLSFRGSCFADQYATTVFCLHSLHVAFSC